MIGKKRMKRWIAQFMGLAMVLAMGLMFSINAMADYTQKEVTLAGVKIHATSTVYDTSGYGSTACVDYIPEVTVKVKGTYTYVHPVTGESGSYSCGWTEGRSGVSITYFAPDKYKTLSMQCDHEAAYDGQHWSCSTVISQLQ